MKVYLRIISYNDLFSQDLALYIHHSEPIVTFKWTFAGKKKKLTKSNYKWTFAEKWLDI